MTSRRDRKQQAVAHIRAIKAEINELPKTERHQAKKDLKAQWRERKKQIAGLPRSARRPQRAALKQEKKIYHRPRRFITWGIVGVLAGVVAFAAAPFLAAMSNLLTVNVDSSTPAAAQAREAAHKVSSAVADEGVVLLTNEGETLPLAEDRINVFGFESFNLRYGGAGSGAADLSSASTLYEALDAHGITANPDLIAAHEEAGAASEADSSPGLIGLVKSWLTRDSETEPAPDYLTPDVLAQAREYAETAMIVVGNDGAEAVDFTPDQLRLTSHQQDLVEKVADAFEEVIVVVNSGNQMELGFLEEHPSITAAVWIGTPGPFGGEALARTLTGEVNPSGRLPVTYAYDVESAPAVENFGDYRYSNANRAFLDYEEGL